jgi:hypothetical protein
VTVTPQKHRAGSVELNREPIVDGPLYYSYNFSRIPHPGILFERYLNSDFESPSSQDGGRQEQQSSGRAEIPKRSSFVEISASPVRSSNSHGPAKLKSSCISAVRRAISLHCRKSILTLDTPDLNYQSAAGSLMLE